MPTFCRHSRLIQNCPICSREQGVEMRPVVTSGAPRSTEPRERSSSDRSRRASERDGAATSSRRASRSSSAGGSNKGVRVRRLARGADDGFSSPLVPGLKSSEDAERLAEEIAFAAHRLTVMAGDAPGLWGEVAGGGRDLEERTWLAFLIAYIGPSEELEDPFEHIRSAWVDWGAVSAGESPRFEGVVAGPRGGFDPARADATIEAYRGWAQRAGSQAAAFQGEATWTPERRFERLFERLALPGLHRDGRFELLTSLGRLGLYELRPGKLQLTGENEATWAAKRALGIADPILLERRATELAAAAGAPLDALDLGFHNWGSGVRIGAGIDPEAGVDEDVLEQARDALGL